MTQTLEQAIVAFVRKHLGADVEVEFGRLPARPYAASVRIVPTDPSVRQYLSGGGISRCDYDVYMSAQTNTTEARVFDAFSLLSKLSLAIERNLLPEHPAIHKHEIIIAPVQSSVQAGGIELFMLRARITYANQ